MDAVILLVWLPDARDSSLSARTPRRLGYKADETPPSKWEQDDAGYVKDLVAVLAGATEEMATKAVGVSDVQSFDV